MAAGWGWNTVRKKHTQNFALVLRCDDKKKYGVQNYAVLKSGPREG